MTAVFQFDNTYARELDGFYAPLAPAKVPEPEVVLINHDLAATLGVDLAGKSDETLAQLFSGNLPPEGASPLAQAYAGHQFGGFSPQLGDGRAHLLGEVIDSTGQRRDIALKGSGRTPFSRGGDGKAALGPVLREYIMGEAMAALGIPTTRALAAVTTGESVMRDAPLKGAVLTRVAASHLRVGTFQFFAARQMQAELRQLADYAIGRHDPDLAGTDGRYLAFFERVVTRQARLIAKWMGVGFIHGVMNTDNMTISGETIDYGPCAFMDTYDPAAVFSSIDHQGRYAYGNQPAIAKWNLARLAECLLPLFDDDAERATAQAMEVLGRFDDLYQSAWQEIFAAKLGFDEPSAAVGDLANRLLEHLAKADLDFTGSFAGLAKDSGAGLPPELDDWRAAWRASLNAANIAPQSAAGIMSRANPLYIPRNHLVEEALGAAHEGDLAPTRALLERVTAPYTPEPGAWRFAEAAPASFGQFVTYCGT